MKVLGIVPARAGSKGIRNKNLAKICGKSLLRHTTDTAKRSMLDAVVVSTDIPDKNLIEAGVGDMIIYQRPKELASDDSATVDALHHVLTHTVTRADYDAVMCLQPTNPLRTAEDINNAILTMETTGCDSVISVTQVEDWLPQRMMYLEDERLSWLHESTKWARRQDCGRMYLRDGSIYLATTQLIREKRLVGDSPRWLFIPRERSVRIDTPFDLEYAAWLLTRQAEKAKIQADN